MKFKKLLFLIASILSLTVFSSCASGLYKSAIYYERKKAGLINKTTTIDNYTIHYLESGKGTPILMLHGFGGEKDHWVRFTNYLENKYRFIAPDLPGFGDNLREENRSYSYTAQVKAIHQFMQKIAPGEKYHIVGNSMGGGISGLYAAEYPDEILSLTLIDAGGVESKEESELTINLKKGVNLLVVKNEKDFERLMKFSFYKEPAIPGSVKNFIAEKAIQNYPFNTRIFEEVMKEKFLLQSKLDKIKAPTLIIWGDSDKILHPGSAEIFAKGIKNSRKTIIKDCGHIPMLEVPEVTAGIYTNFISGL